MNSDVFVMLSQVDAIRAREVEVVSLVVGSYKSLTSLLFFYKKIDGLYQEDIICIEN